MITVEVYRSRNVVGRQKYRCRAVAENGRKLATSGEAYVNPADIEDVVLALFGRDTSSLQVAWPSGIHTVLREVTDG